MKILNSNYGDDIADSWRLKGFFIFFSLPWVVGLIKTKKDIWMLFLIIPYSVIYFPLLTFANTLGQISFIWRYKKMKIGERGW